MNDGPESLAAARAAKAGDGTLWTPEELLEDLLKSIRAGEIDPQKMVVHWLEPFEGRDRHGYAQAGMNMAEHTALLALSLHHICNEW